jgi:hypothetical protein
MVCHAFFTIRGGGGGTDNSREYIFNLTFGVYFLGNAFQNPESPEGCEAGGAFDVGLDPQAAEDAGADVVADTGTGAEREAGATDVVVVAVDATTLVVVAP